MPGLLVLTTITEIDKRLKTSDKVRSRIVNVVVEETRDGRICLLSPCIEHPAMLFQHQNKLTVLGDQALAVLYRSLQGKRLHCNAVIGSGKSLCIRLGRFEFGLKLFNAAFELTLHLPCLQPAWNRAHSELAPFC